MIALRALPALLIAVAVALAQTPIIIDTDAGSDDALAVALLLSHPDIAIEAITVVNGMAHVEAGGRNMRRLLDLASRTSVPVFAGRPAPLRGHRQFPTDWRKLSDSLPGVHLPPGWGPAEPKPAADYLIERLRNGETPVQILALGPLTNIAEALQQDGSIAGQIRELVIMGGAIRVPGNAPDQAAEWNMFIDPFAAQIVFRSRIPIRLITLDATNKVPLGLDFVRDFRSKAHTPLGRVVSEVLDFDKEQIAKGTFYAWDPLAAAALLNPQVVQTVPIHIRVTGDGRTLLSNGPPNANAAIDADAHLFLKMFIESFSRGAPGP